MLHRSKRDRIDIDSLESLPCVALLVWERSVLKCQTSLVDGHVYYLISSAGYCIPIALYFTTEVYSLPLRCPCNEAHIAGLGRPVQLKPDT
jgi:hypothetical protein